MSYLMSNIPHFPCWVRREFTHNHLKYHGEFLHALAIGVNTIMLRRPLFYIVFLPSCLAIIPATLAVTVIYFLQA